MRRICNFQYFGLFATYSEQFKSFDILVNQQIRYFHTKAFKNVKVFQKSKSSNIKNYIFENFR